MIGVWVGSIFTSASVFVVDEVGFAIEVNFVDLDGGVGCFRRLGVGVRLGRLEMMPDGTATNRCSACPGCLVITSDNVSVEISSKLPNPRVQSRRTDSLGFGRASDVDSVAPVPGPDNVLSENCANVRLPGNCVDISIGGTSDTSSQLLPY